MAAYGATKSATTYFTASVAAELEGTGLKIGTIFPGVVITDMLISQFDGAPEANWLKARRLYNTIGDTVETVAPFLARQILANDRNGAVIRWLTIPKALVRFLVRATESAISSRATGRPGSVRDWPYGQLGTTHAYAPFTKRKASNWWSMTIVSPAEVRADSSSP